MEKKKQKKKYKKKRQMKDVWTPHRVNGVCLVERESHWHWKTKFT